MSVNKHPQPQAPDPDPEVYQAAFNTYQYPAGSQNISQFPPGYGVSSPGQSSSYTYAGTTESTRSQKTVPSQSTKVSSGGLFSSITKAGADLARKGLVATNKAVDTLAQKLDETLAKHYGDSAVLNLFQTGNVVQLISKTTGRTLQILQASNGQLILDGMGPDDPHAFNTHFIITREPNNIVTLHNNYNYLVIVNGYTTVHRAAEQGHVTLHCRMILHEPTEKYVSFESTQEKNTAVGVASNGSLKSALTTRPTDRDALFAVRLIYSPHGAPPTLTSRSKT